ncbi:MAG: hypothetical protein KC620_19925 [Myxococcales bacterium]|nr:hypothetical protein [Myxococcales bacterium]
MTPLRTRWIDAVEPVADDGQVAMLAKLFTVADEGWIGVHLLHGMPLEAMLLIRLLPHLTPQRPLLVLAALARWRGDLEVRGAATDAALAKLVPDAAAPDASLALLDRLDLDALLADLAARFDDIDIRRTAVRALADGLPALAGHLPACIDRGARAAALALTLARPDPKLHARLLAHAQQVDDPALQRWLAHAPKTTTGERDG